MQKKTPVLVRPQLSPEVGNRFWRYCQRNGLVVGAAADQAVTEWLDRREAESQSKEEQFPFQLAS